MEASQNEAKKRLTTALSLLPKARSSRNIETEFSYIYRREIDIGVLAILSSYTLQMRLIEAKLHAVTLYIKLKLKYVTL